MSAEEPNVERILRHLNREEFSYATILERLKKNEQRTVVPPAVDNSIAQIIDNIARPFEEKARKHAITVSAMVLAVCLFVMGIVIDLIETDAQPIISAITIRTE